jgi:hypothetical protein
MTEQTGSQPNFWLYPPQVGYDVFMMQQLFAAYRAGLDSEYLNWWDFGREVMRGHIVTGAVITGGRQVAYFGVELMELPSPWLNLLFYSGEISRPIMRGMVWQLYGALQHYKADLGRSDEVGSVRILGRPGWRRIAGGLGIEMDRRGFVFDDQKGLKDGYVRRFQ